MTAEDGEGRRGTADIAGKTGNNGGLSQGERGCGCGGGDLSHGERGTRNAGAGAEAEAGAGAEADAEAGLLFLDEDGGVGADALLATSEAEFLGGCRLDGDIVFITAYY